jgi:hypothetical protein
VKGYLSKGDALIAEFGVSVFKLYHVDNDASADLLPLLREGKSGAKQHQSMHQGSNKV